MRPPLRSLLSMLFALLVGGSPVFAHGESLFQSCQALPEPALPQRGTTFENAQRPALAKMIGEELGGYLQESKANLESLRAWLEPHRSWPSVTARDCHKDPRCVLLLGALPRLHGRFRKLLSLAVSADPMSWQLWKLSAAGNPRLWSPPFAPKMAQQQPLSPREMQLAEHALLEFWDGIPLSDAEQVEYTLRTGSDAPEIKDSVIEDFMAILRRRIERQTEMPVQRGNDARLLKAFEQTRRRDSPLARVEAAMMIADPSWDRYRRSRLDQFHQKNRETIWSLVDQVRPLVYLTDPVGISPDHVAAAISASILDVTKFATKVQSAVANVDLEFLFDFHIFADLGLQSRPDLCAVANTVAGEIATQERRKQIAIATALSIPLIVLLPPFGAALSGAVARAALFATGAGGSLALTMDVRARAEHLQEVYMGEGKMDAMPNGWMNHNEVAPAKIRAAFGPLTFLVTLGLPTSRLSAIKKMLQ